MILYQTTYLFVSHIINFQCQINICYCNTVAKKLHHIIFPNDYSHPIWKTIRLLNDLNHVEIFRLLFYLH